MRAVRATSFERNPFAQTAATHGGFLFFVKGRWRASRICDVHV